MKKKSFWIKLTIFILNLFIFLLLLWLFFSGRIFYELFLALIFLQAFTDTLLLGRYLLYKRFKRLASEMGFKLITGYLEQPRLEGYYKNKWWQIHYVSKETKYEPGILRTYVKLQWKRPKKFNKKLLKKYDNIRLGKHEIIKIKHIVRPYKNYLLLKRRWFTLDKQSLYELMDFLIKVAKECEMKK